MRERRCDVSGCDREGKIRRGMCNLHYGRWLAHGDPNVVKLDRSHPDECSVDGCDEPYQGKGLCAIHYSRQWRAENPGKKRRQRESEAPIELECFNCGSMFTRTRARRQTRYFCSSDCYAESNTKPPAHHRAKKALHRARRRQAIAEGEQFDPQEIFDRDGWRCGICGGKVPRSAKVPNPRAATLDHIHPLAEGGEHARVNVQCAHFACNIAKSHTGPGQLRLIG